MFRELGTALAIVGCFGVPYGLYLQSTAIGEVGVFVALRGITISAWGVGAVIVGVSTHRPQTWTRASPQRS